jgi:Uma2 family endonuclease
MTAALTDPPPSGEWTTDDLDSLPDDGLRRELLDGALLMSPSPTRLHQTIAGRLMVALEASCPAEWDVTQAVEIRISRKRAFIPDVLVARLDAAVHNPSWYLPEDVVLAVEIVSPGSTSMDRWLKPGAYAEAGIPFFWRVEIEGGLTVHAHRLDPSSVAYEETDVFTKELTVTEPWPITLSLPTLLPRQL